MTKTLIVIDVANENELTYSVYSDGDRGGRLTADEFSNRDKFKNCYFKKTMRFFKIKNSLSAFIADVETGVSEMSYDSFCSIYGLKPYSEEHVYSVSSNVDDDTPDYAATIYFEDC